MCTSSMSLLSNATIQTCCTLPRSGTILLFFARALFGWKNDETPKMHIIMRKGYRDTRCHTVFFTGTGKNGPSHFFSISNRIILDIFAHIQYMAVLTLKRCVHTSQWYIQPFVSFENTTFIKYGMTKLNFLYALKIRPSPYMTKLML